MLKKTTSNSWRRFNAYFSTEFSKNRYIAHYDAEQIEKQYTKLAPESFFHKVFLLVHPLKSEPFRKATRLVRNIETARHHHNQAFLKAELKKTQSFFNDVDGHSLDQQQRRAILTNEDNSLIVAGAGSGKTTTIIGKIDYVTKKLCVPPDKILVISFTKKSAIDLAARLKKDQVEPQTFHGFGYHVLKQAESGKKPDIYDGKKNTSLLEGFLEEETANQSYLADLASWFLNYQRIPVSQFEFSTLGEYEQYLKDQGYQAYTRVRVPYQGSTTYKRETVRSIEECIIANFLLFNRVDYAYEESYPLYSGTSKYEPDFTITHNGKTIYLEHFGIDRKGNVPSFFARQGETVKEASQRYNTGIQWKKSLHKEKKTTLIETYSYDFTEGSLIERLESKLKKEGIVLDPMTPEETWEVIRKSEEDDVSIFIKLVESFLALLKSNGYTLQEIRSKSRSQKLLFSRDRTAHFLRLFKPLQRRYETYLQDEGKIDFADMINRATQLLNTGSVRRQYKYVIIDEFQDLSIGRYQLLRALKDQNPSVKFFCVGDDWQSIYRFTGSDSGLFQRFEKYFGYTATAKIETTYRFNEPMIGVSGGFVMKNPTQTKKNLRAPVSAFPATYDVVKARNDDDTEALRKIFSGMATAGFSSSKKIMLIGRYNNDFNRIRNMGSEMRVYKDSKKLRYEIKQGKHQGKSYVASFVTAHGAKGLEADVVIVLNCNVGSFPSERADDPMLNLLLSKADTYGHGEERRLFYVAMTRAKQKTYFVTSPSKPSQFVEEMRSDDKTNSTRMCPKCVTGDLTERRNRRDNSQFLGCTNYPDCTYIAQSSN